MNCRSHPSALLLLDYARGRLPLAPGLTVSAHLDGCAHCRDSAGLIEDAAGEALLDLPDAPLAEGALEATIARLHEKTPPPMVSAPPGAGAFAEVSLPAAAAAVGFAGRRWVAPGMWVAQSRAPHTDGWRTFLLRLPAGGSLPPHRHRGDELVCVLEGSFTDGDAWFRPGDFTQSRGGDGEHRVRAADDAPCICMVSTQRPLEWLGWMKLYQPIVGI